MPKFTQLEVYELTYKDFFKFEGSRVRSINQEHKGLRNQEIARSLS